MATESDEEITLAEFLRQRTETIELDNHSRMGYMLLGILAEMDLDYPLYKYMASALHNNEKLKEVFEVYFDNQT